MKKVMNSCIVALCIGIITIYSGAASAPSTKGIYPTNELRGRTVSDLYARYLGIRNKTTIPSYLAIDYQKNFAGMWQQKNQRCRSTVVRQASDTLVSDYSKRHTTTSFKAYTTHITTVVENLKKAIDWTKVKNVTHLSQNDVNLVKNIALSFDGKDMTAYILTELMPSAEGRLNVSVLNFLLQHAGKEYIEGIPAMYDSKTSFGPYQFTEYALYSTKHQKRGASVINEAVRGNEQIPGSVIRLKGDDHHRAAFLFIVYNLCEMVKGLNTKEKKVLATLWVKHPDDLFLYCATAHHLPAVARRACKNWLDNNMRYKFESSCNKKIIGYAKKTRNNLAAI